MTGFSLFCSFNSSTGAFSQFNHLLIARLGYLQYKVLWKQPTTVAIYLLIWSFKFLQWLCRLLPFIEWRWRKTSTLRHKTCNHNATSKHFLTTRKQLGNSDVFLGFISSWLDLPADSNYEDNLNTQQLLSSTFTSAVLHSGFTTFNLLWITFISAPIYEFFKVKWKVLQNTKSKAKWTKICYLHQKAVHNINCSFCNCVNSYRALLP